MKQKKHELHVSTCKSGLPQPKGQVQTFHSCRIVKYNMSVLLIPPFILLSGRLDSGGKNASLPKARSAIDDAKIQIKLDIYDICHSKSKVYS